MGTNYYLHTNVCDHCHRGDGPRHIGKTSVGWVFALHVYPDEGIRTLQDWKKLFAEKSIAIKNEYGQELPAAMMLEAITERSRPSRESVPMGYGSWDEFHERNHSLDGPNNLLRHQISEGYCIGHGEGPWDYLVGDFS